MKHLKSTILILILWAFALVAKAQITGVVLDEATGAASRLPAWLTRRETLPPHATPPDISPSKDTTD